jgi:putative CocE/NonD family hydrolase
VNSRIETCRLAISALGLLLASCGHTATGPIAPAEPKHSVRVERSVLVPMRDGVQLSTDLYFPENAGEKLPVIMIRTPYNKNVEWTAESGHWFAGQGYVVAIQDVRGRFESQGEYIVSARDTEDGYDMIDWLARQPWSTGQVGTYGCSYLGENQVQTATLRNPHHVAMIPQASGGSRRYFALYQGGVLELAAGAEWFRGNGSKVRPMLSPATSQAAFTQAAQYYDFNPVLPEIDDPRAIYRSLPIIDLLDRMGAPPSDWEGIVSHGLNDPWWDQFGYIEEDDRFNTPALFIDSWYDYGPADTMALRKQFSRNADSDLARNNLFAVIAPTTHCAYESAEEHTFVGDRDVGDARLDFKSLYLKWFDYWLKGIENGVTEMPKLQIYVMGRGEWRGENEWPLARTEFTKYYLHSDGNANSRVGTGKLSTDAPTQPSFDRFVYDPEAPVPSAGGPDWGASHPDLRPGGIDQRQLEMRNDVLVYTSPPLEKGIEVTGPLELVLYVSSSARDTDFTGKLVDVYPDGTAYNIQEGILRARYREGFDRKVWMKEGEVYEVRIDLSVTSNFFRPGHRIRLEVSSSNYPRFDRNLNTGGNNFDETEWVTSENTVHHSSVYPSHLVLPVIP